jgi:putative methionine-R-sulfoxide reductase with GAF domain
MIVILEKTWDVVSEDCSQTNKTLVDQSEVVMHHIPANSGISATILTRGADVRIHDQVDHYATHCCCDSDQRSSLLTV